MPLQDATRHHWMIITGFGKRKSKVFEEFPNLIHGVGRDGQRDTIEVFVCRLYRAEDPKAGVNKSRTELLEKGNKDLEKLPPTQRLAARLVSGLAQKTRT